MKASVVDVHDGDADATSDTDETTGDGGRETEDVLARGADDRERR